MQNAKPPHSSLHGGFRKGSDKGAKSAKPQKIWLDLAQAKLSLAAAACVATVAMPIGVAIGTGIAAIVLAVFLNRPFQAYDAQARLASTFHLSHSCSHDRVSPFIKQGFVIQSEGCLSSLSK
jgi:hypothetical protein